MSEQTKIEWATHTFNPWIGCTKVSPGCLNCYAEHTTRARVLRHHGHETWGKGKQRSRTSAVYWSQPGKWNRQAAKEKQNDIGPFREQRPRVFPSLCDWLDDGVPIEWLADFLKLIQETPNLDWLLLTKRPEGWKSQLARALTCVMTHGPVTELVEAWLNGSPPNHIWIGASAEDQPRLDQRVPELLKIPAVVRFLSLEPLLGGMNLKPWLAERLGDFIATPNTEGDLHAFPSKVAVRTFGVDWIIVGGESGPKARPCNVEWIRDIMRQCKAAGTPCFVKQLGSVAVMPTKFADGSTIGLGLKHSKGGDPSEWPEDLRVREFPRAWDWVAASRRERERLKA